MSGEKIKERKTKYYKGDTVVCKKDYKQYITNESDDMYHLLLEKGKKYTIDDTIWVPTGTFHFGKEVIPNYRLYYKINNMHFQSTESYEDNILVVSTEEYSDMIFDDYFVKDKKDVPMDWEEYFYELAVQVSKKSKDKSTKTGAVIVGEDNEVLSVGYNSFPRGCDDDLPERQERPEKYFWFEHAERNAIYNAARAGISVKGGTMYLTCHIPCMDCARGIINSGIKTVYCVNHNTTQNEDKWGEHAIRSKKLFEECGIKLIFY